MSGLKAWLKRSDVLLAVNARVKARALVRQRARLARDYGTRAKADGIVYDPNAVPRQVADRLVARGIDPQRFPERMRVLWIGADLNQDIAGFLPALDRHADVVRFHRATGEYGVQIRSADGRTRQYDPAVVESNDSQLIAILDQHARVGEPIDMVLGQMWAHTLSAATLQTVQARGIVTVNVSMDDRLPVLWRAWRGYPQGSLGILAGLDLVLTTSPECCLWYAVEGAASLWWPLASDPGVFAPAPEDQKEFDISFVGSRYGIRAHIVNALLKAGMNVTAFGPGWPRGAVNADAVASIFARSRMILGIGTIAHNTDVYTIKLRDFDATMAGSVYITHRNPDLLRLFTEDFEILCYTTTDELVAKVRDCLSHPQVRKQIAANARIRALRNHTWDQRFAQLFSVVRGRNAPQDD